MAEPAGAAASPDIDPDFEPQSRPRSCTWPLPRPEAETGGAAGAAEEGAGGAAAGPGRTEGARAGGAAARKGGSRRNAWGSQSYAELISQAIESAPEKRLTLAQIYEWMVRSVPYFKDKGDSNSSAGWKVRDGPRRGTDLVCRGQAGRGAAAEVPPQCPSRRPLRAHLLLLLVCGQGVGASAWCPRCRAWASVLLKAPHPAQASALSTWSSRWGWLWRDPARLPLALFAFRHFPRRERRVV